MTLEQMPSGLRYGLDGVSGVVAVGALADALPPIAAALSIIWLLIQIYDRFFAGCVRRVLDRKRSER